MEVETAALEAVATLGERAAAAQQLLDALLERPLSSLPMKERLGVYLARGTARAMLAREGKLQGAPSCLPAPCSYVRVLTGDT